MLSLGLREPHISLLGGVLPRFCQWKALRSPAEQEGDRTCFSRSVCSFCQISLGKSLSPATPLVHLSGSSMHFWGQPQGCPWWPASALPLDSAPVCPSAVGSSEHLKQHHRLGSAPSSEVRVRLLPAPLPSSRFLGPPFSSRSRRPSGGGCFLRLLSLRYGCAPFRPPPFSIMCVFTKSFDGILQADISSVPSVPRLGPD